MVSEGTLSQIERCSAARLADWISLRRQLYPGTPLHAHETETADILRDEAHKCCFLALDLKGRAIGMIEVTVRFEYVNGTTNSPVGFIESIYVAADARRGGIARQLAARAEIWAREKGCREMASDALLENTDSQEFHRKIGFREMERIVCFSKVLNQA